MLTSIPTAWLPDLSKHDGPLYERIAAALEDDIRAGLLLPGTRLPTLKELARHVNVTAGTVSRAYELAQRRGLIEGEVGRGTFVLAVPAVASAEPTGVPAPTPSAFLTSSSSSGGAMDLSIIKPNLELQEPYLRAALFELSQATNLPDMLDYTPDGGLAIHREAGATWMRNLGFDANPEQTVLVAGAQHGLWVAINAMTRPGDLIFCEAQCYPGIAAAALLQGRRVIGVEMDEYGIRGDRLRELCMRERPSLLICVANLQNPTTAIMPIPRRIEIAEIAREFDFVLLDDDLYGFLLPERIPPLSNFAPERSIYITSLSKSVASSVRTGYLHCPPEWLPRMTAAVRASIWMVTPLSAQLATLLIHSGKAQEMAKLQRDEASERQILAKKLLRNYEYRSQPTAFHLWLTLPQHTSYGSNFANLARSHRLLIAGGDEFCIKRCNNAHRHIRIALMSGDRQSTAVALTKLAGLLDTDTSIWL